MRNSIFRTVVRGIGAIVFAAIVAMTISHFGFALLDQQRRIAHDQAHLLLTAAHGVKMSAEAGSLSLLQFLNSGEPRHEEQARRHAAAFQAQAARLDALAQEGELKAVNRGIIQQHAALDKLAAELIELRGQTQTRLSALSTQMQRVNSLFATDLHDRFPGDNAAARDKLTAIRAMQALVSAANADMARVFRDPRAVPNMVQGCSELRTALSSFKNLTLDAVQQRAVRELESLQGDTLESMRQLSGQTQRLHAGIERALGLQYELANNIDTRLTPLATASAAAIDGNTDAHQLKMLATLAGMSLALALLALWAGHYIYQSLVYPMRQLARGATAVSEGRLDHRIQIDNRGDNEISEVARTFNNMVDRLQATTVSKSILEEKERELRTLLDSVHDYAIFVTNIDGYITSWNTASTRIFGYESQEISRASFARLFKERAQARQIRDEAWAAIKTHNRFETDTRMMRKDGNEFDANFVVTPLLENGVTRTGYTVVVRDITQRRNAERHITQLATRDALTGLHNRSTLMEKMNLAISHASRAGHQMAVMFIDLDHFKEINDTLGHVAGDVLLSTVAKRLSDCVRDIDVVARWGGDEFVVLLTDIAGGQAGVAPVAQRMMQSVTTPVRLMGHHAQTSASIGICMYPADGEDSNTLMKHADIAMYYAKEAQRNNFKFFAPEMNERVLKRLQLERDFSDALQNNQFVLHYQPQVSVHSGEITGVEALVRWQHPVEGLMAPAGFIGLAEETGLIKPLGAWILKEACRRIKQWHEAGLNVPYIVVNVSAAQLNSELPNLVRQALLEHAIEPGWLMLEITETLLMEHVEEVIDTLTRIRELGIRVAMDDFGTGYSSLSVLQRLPLNTLKIDRSFLSAIQDDGANNERAVAIIAAIVAIAKELDLAVVAEGVETNTQLAFLRTLDCDAYQGYLYSKPLEESQLLALAARPLKSVLEDKDGRAVTMSQRVTMDLLLPKP